MTDPEKGPVRNATDLVYKDPVAQTFGISIDEARDSYARLRLTVKDEFCNFAGRTHGGVLFILADQAFAVAANSRGHQAVAAELKINYFQATRPGDVIIAEATPIDIRKRISLWNIELRTRSDEKVALAQGLAYHLE